MNISILQKWFEEKMDETGKDFLFPAIPINQIPSNCCACASTKVIDFDAVARWNGNDLASADCLFLSTIEGTLYLLEMKGWSDFLNIRIRKQCSSEEEIHQLIEKSASKLNFSQKLDDSLFILQNIINSQELRRILDSQGIKRKDFRANYAKVPKHYIYVSDLKSIKGINPLDKFSASLNMLATTNPAILKYEPIIDLLDKLTGEKFGEINHNDYGSTNVQKPFRLDSTEIDIFFEQK